MLRPFLIAFALDRVLQAVFDEMRYSRGILHQSRNLRSERATRDISRILVLKELNLAYGCQLLTQKYS
jgi:hypothetical protein